MCSYNREAEKEKSAGPIRHPSELSVVNFIDKGVELMRFTISGTSLENWKDISLLRLKSL